jgi:hypothetical protein
MGNHNDPDGVAGAFGHNVLPLPLLNGTENILVSQLLTSVWCKNQNYFNFGEFTFLLIGSKKRGGGGIYCRKVI